MHQVIHTDKRDFACTQCDRNFNRAERLRRHLVRVHGVGGRTKDFACEFCPKAFWDKYALSRHQKLMHPGQIPEDACEFYSCEPCGYTCAIQGYLGIHKKTRRHKERMAELEGRVN
jgi:hypothetical protein